MRRIAPSSPHPRLDVRDLELVLALAAAGSTSSAAGSLHLTQSAVSRALLLAEGKLGVRLFDRAARGLAPTSAGERLIAGARPLLAQLAELEHHVGAPSPPTRIRLVCECYTAYHWLPSALKSLRRSLPSLEVVLAIDHTQGPVEALVGGEIDVALLTTSPIPKVASTSRGRERGGALDERALFSDEIVFVVASHHPLAAHASITPHDLATHPLLVGNAAPGEARWFSSAVFGRKKPDLAYLRLPLTEAIVDAARAGMGIAVLSEWIASHYLGGEDLVAKRLVRGPLYRPWRIAFRRDAENVAMRLAGALEGLAPRGNVAMLPSPVRGSARAPVQARSR